MVRGRIAVKNANNTNLATVAKVTIKNCPPFLNCWTEINDTFADEADFINIAMLMYNLIEYSDNHSDTLGSWWQMKRDEIENNAYETVANSSSFRYKSNFVDNTDNTRNLKGLKIAVPLKQLTKSWGSLEMPLINCKVELSLTWIENCILATSVNIADDAIANTVKATIKITDAKIYVSIVTLSTGISTKLSKRLTEGSNGTNIRWLTIKK